MELTKVNGTFKNIPKNIKTKKKLHIKTKISKPDKINIMFN